MRKLGSPGAVVSEMVLLTKRLNQLLRVCIVANDQTAHCEKKQYQFVLQIAVYFNGEVFTM
jgi:hypothetical protein